MEVIYVKRFSNKKLAKGYKGDFKDNKSKRKWLLELKDRMSKIDKTLFKITYN